jgi:hypothetical protein
MKIMPKQNRHNPSCYDCVHASLRPTESPCFSCQQHVDYPRVKPSFVAARDLTPTGAAPEKKVDYLVYVSGKGQPTHIHNTLTEAKIEAERLAKLNPNHKVYVVTPVATCTTETVTKWEDA